MWGFLKQVLTLRALTLPVTVCLELPSCVSLRDTRELGCPTRSDLEDCWAQSQFSPFLPTHFFPWGRWSLEGCLLHFWERVVKKGCAANVSEMGMCQFIHKVGCVVNYTLRVCGTQIHVLDMLHWGFLHTFLHALCSACGYTLHLQWVFWHWSG